MSRANLILGAALLLSAEAATAADAGTAGAPARATTPGRDAGPSGTDAGADAGRGAIDGGAAKLLQWMYESGKPAAAPSDAGVLPPYDASGCAACHAGLTQHKHSHGVFVRGTCADCHLVSEKVGKCTGAMPGKGWRIAKEEPELCGKCHDVRGKAPMHSVITAMGCTACHDPHGSENPASLKLWPQEKLCYECHPRKDDKKNVHSAVMLGECLGCHSPHAGEEAPLLKKSRLEVCFECHEQESMVPNPVKHAPAAEGRCLECHEPHSTDSPKLLRATGTALCMKCHDGTRPWRQGEPVGDMRLDLGKEYVHPALSMGDCQDCHEQVHSAENAKLLRKGPPALCYTCHERKDDMKFTHGAVRLGDCPVCHDPHASETKVLLRKPTVSGLCYQCHQDDVTGRAFVHRPVAEGKCNDCHSPHGSKARFNLTRAAPGELPKLELAVKNRFNLTIGEGKQACYACHKTVDDVKVKHKALERHGCTGCHDPHGTNNRFQLIKPVNALCQSCHPDKTDGMHATTFVSGGHAVSGPWDPRRPDRTFTCASCHNPHGSDSEKLFYYGLDGMEMCDSCHGDKTGKHPELKDIHRKRPAQVSTPAATGAPLVGAGLDAG
ncbi:MAG: cytochrome c3 family protein, partial [Myxococcaceae bacterium]